MTLQEQLAAAAVLYLDGEDRETTIANIKAMVDLGPRYTPLVQAHLLSLPWGAKLLHRLRGVLGAFDVSGKVKAPWRLHGAWKHLSSQHQETTLAECDESVFHRVSGTFILGDKGDRAQARRLQFSESRVTFGGERPVDLLNAYLVGSLLRLPDKSAVTGAMVKGSEFEGSDLLFKRSTLDVGADHLESHPVPCVIHAHTTARLVECVLSSAEVSGKRGSQALFDNCTGSDVAVTSSESQIKNSVFHSSRFQRPLAVFDSKLVSSQLWDCKSISTSDLEACVIIPLNGAEIMRSRLHGRGSLLKNASDFYLGDAYLSDVAFSWDGEAEPLTLRLCGNNTLDCIEGLEQVRLILAESSSGNNDVNDVDERTTIRRTSFPQGVAVDVLPLADHVLAFNSCGLFEKFESRQGLGGSGAPGRVRLEFAHSHLEEIRFDSEHLRGASFRDCYLNQVDFSGADLSGADFTGATLQKVIFDGAILNRVAFTGATFEDTYLDQIKSGVGLALPNMR